MIVKNRFLPEALKVFWCVTRELFVVFDEMNLVKEIVLIANFIQFHLVLVYSENRRTQIATIPL